MSEPAPEPQGGGTASGGFFSKKFMGIPAIVWLLGAAVLAYLYFKNKSASSTGAGATSTSGSGTSTTGDITLSPGTEDIQVSPQVGPNDTTATTTSGTGTTTVGSGNTTTDTGNTTTTTTNTTNPQPTPPPKPPTKTGTTTVTYTSYTVKPGDTLASLAKRYGISVADLAHSNVYVSGEVPGNKKVGQTLGTGAGLKTGQVLKIPHYKVVSS